MPGYLSVQLVSKISNLCDHKSPTSQTDGQTTCARKTALCTMHRTAELCNDALRTCFPNHKFKGFSRMELCGAIYFVLACYSTFLDGLGTVRYQTRSVPHHFGTKKDVFGTT